VSMMHPEDWWGLLFVFTLEMDSADSPKGF
jgi:hypothetical protein